MESKIAKFARNLICHLRVLNGDAACQEDLPAFYRFIFNKIEPWEVYPVERKRLTGHYSGSGPCQATVSGWFGPDFVTILATGVRVCST